MFFIFPCREAWLRFFQPWTRPSWQKELLSQLYICKNHELLAMKFELFVKGMSILMSSHKEQLENPEFCRAFAGLLNCCDAKKKTGNKWGGGFSNFWLDVRKRGGG